MDDGGIRVASTLGLSIPAFWQGTLLVLLFSIDLRWTPPLTWVALTEDPWRNLSIVALPAVTLGIAGVSIGIATLVGGALGLAAGYLHRGLDQVLARLMDLFFAFPSMLLALGISAVLGAGAATATIAIAVVYTPLFFRVMRAAVLAEKSLPYVEAAAAGGAGSWGIIVRHILPNTLSPMIVQVMVSLSYAILIESALSYLGVGVQPSTPSWGTIVNEGKEFLTLSPWISLFPGAFIMLSVLALNLVSDGLRDRLDPRLRG